VQREFKRTDLGAETGKRSSTPRGPYAIDRYLDVVLVSSVGNLLNNYGSKSTP
jgi:hypothetical protein